ncbi:MAG: helix-turn-helix domain-containing protein [Chloroflexi bacterium]|nr:helix-turn-helix domain-containing protein [Chloroflexota bacterium]
MPKAYSLDLRKRVLEAVAAGATRREAAARFHVSMSVITQWRALERKRGDVRPNPPGGARPAGRI